MQGDDPPYLPVGTAVSAKYKGAFCEAKVSKVVRCVKCKITYKMGLGTATVTDEQIRGPLRVGHTVQARHSEKKEFVEATISKIQDSSQYTVVFDDGDITTLRRTALCLKSGRHFNESETLDQLPLTHPEHFGNPVVGGRRGRRSRQLIKEDSSEGEPEEETEPDLDLYSGDIGKVVCVEGNEKKKSKENWFPGLVVVPSAQPTVRINVREEYLIRSFKDGRYYTVPKKEISEFSRDMGARIESTVLADAMNKALQYLDRDELPVHWERATLFDLQIPDSDSDENYSDSSDDEPREEKDHFVAQLYKFMDDRGTPLNKSPMIANRDVDLYRLFRHVHKLGGYNRVTNQSKWRSVTIRLGYHQNQATCNSVKQAYKKYLFSFEEFYRKLGCTMINHPRNAKKHRGRSLIRDRDRATPVNSSPRPDRSEESVLESTPIPIPPPVPPPQQQQQVALVEKKEEEKVTPPVTVVRPKSSLSKKVTEKEEEKVAAVVKKKEVLESSDSSSSSSSNSHSHSHSNSNSSEGTIDVQSDSGQSTSKKDEVKKKTVKERKVKAAGGEKVKALVEQFEEQHHKKEKEKEKEKELTNKDDDKIQQTRSKSQGPKTKETTSAIATSSSSSSSPDRKDPSTSRAILKTPKKEEDKRRGRKRKDTIESGEPKVPQESTPEQLPPSTQPVGIGDKLKVYYGPTHESKVTYEAKVLDMEKNSTGIVYRVHYTGWNTRYDEWIKPARIAENLSNATKAKRLKQSLTPGKATPPKAAGKRGRGQSVSSRPPDPPRSTTPSSVTSSSSRTKSPATPASSKTAGTSRITRGAGADPATNRRTRKTSAHTDVSVLSDSDSESDQSESELSRTRSGGKSDVEVRRRGGPLKRKDKDDDDTEKEDDDKPKRTPKRRKSPEPKSSAAESDDDSSSPPKGRDFDLNQIRSELKGFEKAVKITSADAAALDVSDEKQSAAVDAKPSVSEKKTEEKAKQVEKSLSTDDIYEFKEPEPFEFETRASKLSEDKTTKKRLIPKVFEELDKSPKKKGAKSPPKSETTKDAEEKKRTFKRTPVKKVEEDEDKTPIKEELLTPVKSRPVSSCEDPFDKLVESPSFNIGHSLVGKKSPPTEILKPKSCKSLNMDETLSLFPELPETAGDDSRDRLDLSDTDDTRTVPLFSHKAESSSLDPIFRDFTSSVKCESGDEGKKRSLKDGQSDEDDMINAAIQRAISNTMTDEDSTGDDLFMNQPVAAMYQPKLKPKEDSKPTTSTIVTNKKDATSVSSSSSSSAEDLKEPLSINTKEETKEQKEIKDAAKPKQISPALQETDSSLLEAISLETEMLKKEDTREPQIKIGTKIADSILQKFNMIKKNEEIKPIKVEPKIEPHSPKIEKPEEPIKKEIKIEPEIKQKEAVPEIPVIAEPVEPEVPIEVKKRSNKKVVSREFIEESDTDSTDSEERLVIARSDDDSQTTPSSDKLDFKDTDSNASAALAANTDDSQECERNFKLETIKSEANNIIETIPEPGPGPEPEPEPPKPEPEPLKTEEEPESNISLLLCKETIPGSPAPVPEMSPAQTETRTKPKSAKSLLLEMPFASAPGSSNSKGMLTTNQVELTSSQPQKQPSAIQQKETQPLAVPLEPVETNETTPVIDNTPPTTPESTISNLSPRGGDQGRISPNTADNESCKSTDSGQRAQTTSKVAHYSEEDTLMTTEPCPAAPKKVAREESAAPCRKRRRSCKASDDVPVKRGRKPNVRNIRANSDSDDTSEHSAPGSTPPAGGLTPNATTLETRMSSRSPRPSKFNFIIELDPSMECGQRISLLTQKLSELRKTYNNVKTELACIDRRRKKLRRREREAVKAAKQEMACS